MAEATNAQAFIDPVCGMTVQADSPHHARHEGVEYRFCSARCRAKFLAAPAQYLKQESAPASCCAHGHGHAHAAPATPHAGAEHVEYTCPMHPEIRQLGPGICPLCGMALEPAMPTLDEGENPELADFRRRFWWSLPLSLLAMAVAMAGMWPAAHAWMPSWRPWLELALASPVVLWAGAPLLHRGWLSITGLDTSELSTGMTVVGSNGAALGTIVSIDSPTQVTMSQAATTLNLSELGR